MANKALTSAKRAKNDEFYTQFSDIGKELEAYLQFDSDTFKDKVVYCNCDDPFESDFFRYFVLNFKRFGLKRLITTSYKPSPLANTQLELLSEEPSTNRQKKRTQVTANKFVINTVQEIDGELSLQVVANQLKKNKANEWTPLKGNGDFRSEECIALLKQADIVVTNPPFSLFREYVKQLMEHRKKILIIGSKNSLTYKEVFPLIMTNQIWTGVTGFNKDMLFKAPTGADLTQKAKTAIKTVEGVSLLRSPSIWLTNLDHGRRHQPLPLMTMKENLKFNIKLKSKKKYEQYDNYKAIEVPFTNAIPSDYPGCMGVPISFLDKYNPDQFEICGCSYSYGDPVGYRKKGKGYSVTVNGKNLFKRIFIKHKVS